MAWAPPQQRQQAAHGAFSHTQAPWDYNVQFQQAPAAPTYTNNTYGGATQAWSEHYAQPTHDAQQQHYHTQPQASDPQHHQASHDAHYSQAPQQAHDAQHYYAPQQAHDSQQQQYQYADYAAAAAPAVTADPFSWDASASAAEGGQNPFSQYFTQGGGQPQEAQARSAFSPYQGETSAVAQSRMFVPIQDAGDVHHEDATTSHALHTAHGDPVPRAHDTSVAQTDGPDSLNVSSWDAPQYDAGAQAHWYVSSEKDAPGHEGTEGQFVADAHDAAAANAAPPTTAVADAAYDHGGAGHYDAVPHAHASESASASAEHVEAPSHAGAHDVHAAAPYAHGLDAPAEPVAQWNASREGSQLLEPAHSRSVSEHEVASTASWDGSAVAQTSYAHTWFADSSHGSPLPTVETSSPGTSLHARHTAHSAAPSGWYEQGTESPVLPVAVGSVEAAAPAPPEGSAGWGDASADGLLSVKGIQPRQETPYAGTPSWGEGEIATPEGLSQQTAPPVVEGVQHAPAPHAPHVEGHSAHAQTWFHHERQDSAHSIGFDVGGQHSREASEFGGWFESSDAGSRADPEASAAPDASHVAPEDAGHGAGVHGAIDGARGWHSDAGYSGVGAFGHSMYGWQEASGLSQHAGDAEGGFVSAELTEDKRGDVAVFSPYDPELPPVSTTGAGLAVIETDAWEGGSSSAVPSEPSESGTHGAHGASGESAATVAVLREDVRTDEVATVFAPSVEAASELQPSLPHDDRHAHLAHPKPRGPNGLLRIDSPATLSVEAIDSQGVPIESVQQQQAPEQPFPASMSAVPAVLELLADDKRTPTPTGAPAVVTKAEHAYASHAPSQHARMESPPASPKVQRASPKVQPGSPKLPGSRNVRPASPKVQPAAGEKDKKPRKTFSIFKELEQAAPVANGSHASAPAPAVRAAPRRREWPRDGRPPCAVVSFGFGGRLVVCRRSNADVACVAPAAPPRVEVFAVGRVLGNSDYYRALAAHPGPLARLPRQRVIQRLQDLFADITPLSSFGESDGAASILGILAVLIKHEGALHGGPRGARGIAPDASAAADIVGMLMEEQEQLGSFENEGGPSSASSALSSPPRPALSEAKRAAAIASVERLLVHGERKDAVEAAAAAGLWDHALVIASRVDVATFNSVVARFAAATLTDDSPVRALYGMFAGPANGQGNAEEATSTSGVSAANGLSDAKALAARWRENLSILLSNRVRGDAGAIVALGDRLAAAGLACAAQCCYLSADVPVCGVDTPVRLLGVAARSDADLRRACTDPLTLQRNELYEYARGLGDSKFVLPGFQGFKLSYALQLVDVGLVAEAGRYVESIAAAAKTSGAKAGATYFHSGLIEHLNEISHRLKGKPPSDAAAGGAWWKKGLSSLMGAILTAPDASETHSEAAPSEPAAPSEYGYSAYEGDAHADYGNSNAQPPAAGGDAAGYEAAYGAGGDVAEYDPNAYDYTGGEYEAQLQSGAPVDGGAANYGEGDYGQYDYGTTYAEGEYGGEQQPAEGEGAYGYYGEGQGGEPYDYGYDYTAGTYAEGEYVEGEYAAAPGEQPPADEHADGSNGYAGEGPTANAYAHYDPYDPFAASSYAQPQSSTSQPPQQQQRNKPTTASAPSHGYAGYAYGAQGQDYGFNTFEGSAAGYGSQAPGAPGQFIDSASSAAQAEPPGRQSDGSRARQEATEEDDELMGWARRKNSKAPGGDASGDADAQDGGDAKKDEKRPKKDPWKEAEEKKRAEKGGWLSSFVKSASTWLPKRPANAHLPDGNAFVYDPVKKRWVPTDGSAEEETEQPSAPPSDQQLSRRGSSADMPPLPPTVGAGEPPGGGGLAPPSGANRFSLSGSGGGGPLGKRSARSRYVDTFNPNNSGSGSAASSMRNSPAPMGGDMGPPSARGSFSVPPGVGPPRY